MISGKTKQHEAAKQDRARHKVEATAEQIAEAPVASLGHRIWNCQAEWMAKQRNKWVAPRDLATTSQCNTERHPAWERALQPRPSKPKKSAASEASFKCVVEPEGGMIEGTACSDGSLLDGPISELARSGWASTRSAAVEQRHRRNGSLGSFAGWAESSTGQGEAHDRLPALCLYDTRRSHGGYHSRQATREGECDGECDGDERA